MTRIFRRGELRSALLLVLSDHGAANGYTIMQRLEDHVGAGWRASPGAIYPALLALEDAGQITGWDDHGSRTYGLTAEGRRASAVQSELFEAIARRASDRPPRTTLGALLDGFAADAPKRSASLDADQERAVRAILRTIEHDILSLIDQGASR